MHQVPQKGWRYYLGLALFIYSVAVIGVAACAPLLFSPGIAAMAAGGVLLSGDVAFWLSVAVLGKPFVYATVRKGKGFFAWLFGRAQATSPSGSVSPAPPAGEVSLNPPVAGPGNHPVYRVRMSPSSRSVSTVSSKAAVATAMSSSVCVQDSTPPVELMRSTPRKRRWR